jgi:hypothetical protein
VICGVEFDIEQLLYSIIDQMKQNIDWFSNNRNI